MAQNVTQFPALTCHSRGSEVTVTKDSHSDRPMPAMAILVGQGEMKEQEASQTDLF